MDLLQKITEEHKRATPIVEQERALLAREMDAIQVIAGTLIPLDHKSRRRVLIYLADRFLSETSPT